MQKNPCFRPKKEPPRANQEVLDDLDGPKSNSAAPSVFTSLWAGVNSMIHRL
jgi:hypothetical protein